MPNAAPEPSLGPAFPGVVGHQNATQMLLRALAHDRLHHALLISGPTGVGKAQFARGLACALLCAHRPAPLAETPPPLDRFAGCGTCRDCARVLRATHADFVTVGPSGASRRISRDSMHQAILRLGHAPHEGRAHLCVIDPADRMTADAANVLLKMLEEPPPGVHIVLIATNPRAVLSTLSSRSLPIALGALSQDDSEAVIRQRLQHEFGEEDYDDQNEESPLDQQLRAALQQNTAAVQASLNNIPAYRSATSLAKGQPGQALRLLRDPAVAATQKLCQDLQDFTAQPAALSAIFGGDKHPLWQIWQQTVASHPDPGELAKAQAKAASSEDPVEVVKSGSRKRKKSAKKKTSKKKSSASKKPSLAQQRSALLMLSEIWQLELQDQLRTYSQDPRGRSWLKQMQALELMRRNCHANINPRMLLEHTLCEIARQQKAGA